MGRRRRLPRSRVWVVTAALVVAACGSAESASESARAGPADVAASTTSDAISGPSTTEALIDDPFELIEVAGAGAERANDELTAALDRVGQSCRRGEVSAADLEALIEPIDDLGASLEALRSRTDPQLRSLLYQEIERHALLLDDCTELEPPDDGPETLAVTGRLAAALDRFFGRWNASRESWASALWGNRDRLFAALWMRDLVAADTELEMLVVGSSVAKRAYDPHQLSDGLGVVAGNAAAGGSTPELMAPWLTEIRGTVDPSTIIWGISGSDLYGHCYVDERAEAYDREAGRRRDAYAALTGPPGPGWQHLLGPIGATSYEDTSILDTATTDFEPGTRGLTVNGEAPNRPVIDRLIGDYAEEFATGEVCQARFDLLVQAIEDLLADGLEVIVVALPMLDELAERHPDGVDGPRAALAAVGRDLPAGARFIDHSAPLATEQFTDTFHVTTAGRGMLTDRLIAELSTP